MTRFSESLSFGKVSHAPASDTAVAAKPISAICRNGTWPTSIHPPTARN